MHNTHFPLNSVTQERDGCAWAAEKSASARPKLPAVCKFLLGTCMVAEAAFQTFYILQDSVRFVYCRQHFELDEAPDESRDDRSKLVPNLVPNLHTTQSR